MTGLWRTRRCRGRETTTKPYLCVLPGGETKPSARPVATRRADGGCGRSRRWSSSKMAKHRLPPPALISPRKPHLQTRHFMCDMVLAMEACSASEGLGICEILLSYSSLLETWGILLTGQVVRGSAGLGFAMLAVYSCTATPLSEHCSLHYCSLFKFQSSYWA